MRKFIKMFMVVLVSTVVFGQDTQKIEGFKDCTFAIQGRDVAIRLFVKNSELKKAEHPIIAGCHVTVLLSDRFEMTGNPQCHWDGKKEETKYTYTLYYRLKGDINSVTAYSLNLLDFTSISDGESNKLCVVSMGVLPVDEKVSFRTAKYSEINDRTNPLQLLPKE